MKLLILAVVAMLFQQALAYMSSLVMPVAAPAVAADLNLNPALVGVFTGIVFTGSMISQVSCGGFIIRFGPLRMSQVSLVISGSALIAIMSGVPAIFAVAAFVMGLGTAPSTPASSQILSRYSPPRYAPLIFSVKQTGVPVGAMTAGVLVPFCVATFGWRGAFAVSGLMCLGYALLLQPLRKEFDRDRKPGYSLSPSDVGNLLRAIITTSELRTMAVAAFAFVGLQSLFGSFLVIYLTEGLGYTLERAGYVFAISQGAAIPARIIWGWIGGALAPPRVVLACLGVGMAASTIATGLFDPGWSVVLVTVVAVAYSATAVSWHGVLLAEVARLAPPDRVGATTGGVLAFGSAGMMSYPLIFSAVLGWTGRYDLGFFAGAVPALIAAVLLFRRTPSSASADP